MTTGRRGRTGFTLVELLVVIAIVAILAGILFPVFNRVREAAKATKCMSQMQQITAALVMYCADWHYGPSTTWPQMDITTPWAPKPENMVEVEHPWFCKLGDYKAPYYEFNYNMKDGSFTARVNPLWLCKSGQFTSSYALPQYRGGYYTDWRPDCPTGMVPWHMELTNHPSTCMLLGESAVDMKQGFYAGVVGVRGVWTSFLMPKYTNPPAFPSPTPLKAYWWAHSGGANVAMFDGHIQRMSMDEFYENYDQLWCDQYFIPG